MADRIDVAVATFGLNTTVKYLRQLESYGENWSAEIKALQDIARDVNFISLIPDEIKELSVVDKLILAEIGQDSDLDILVNDENFEVREEVAKHGRPQDLDILYPKLNKSNIFDSEAKDMSQAKESVNVQDSENTNNIFKNMSVRKRIEFAESAEPFALAILINDEESVVRTVVADYGRPEDLDILINDKNWRVREAVAKHGRPEDLDILVHDKDDLVKIEVAHQGRPQDLDILVYDEHSNVREAVAKVGRPEDLDILVYDSEPSVRAVVAKQGRPQDLDILITDENMWVRGVAESQFENITSSKPSLDSEAKDMSAAKDAQDTPAAGHDKDKGEI